MYNPKPNIDNMGKYSKKSVSFTNEYGTIINKI